MQVVNKRLADGGGNQKSCAVVEAKKKKKLGESYFDTTNIAPKNYEI